MVSRARVFRWQIELDPCRMAPFLAGDWLRPPANAMTLTHILVFTAASVLYLTLLPQRGRAWALFVGSVVAIYWLQPATRIRTLDFIFPTRDAGPGRAVLDDHARAGSDDGRATTAPPPG